MLKLTKTGIGLLTRQYRSVLKKCWLLNLGFIIGLVPLNALSQTVVIGEGVLGGAGASATGTHSVAIGTQETLASSYGGVALGVVAKAIGDSCAIAIGHGAVSNNDYTVTLGGNSSATGAWSVTLGGQSHAAGSYSVALGGFSSASEDYVVSVGSNTIKRRITNVAEGTAAHNAVTVSQLGSIAAGTKILNATGTSAISFGTGTGQTTVGAAIATVANELVNNYYTKV